MVSSCVVLPNCIGLDSQPVHKRKHQFQAWGCSDPQVTLAWGPKAHPQVLYQHQPPSESLFTLPQRERLFPSLSLYSYLSCTNPFSPLPLPSLPSPSSPLSLLHPPSSHFETSEELLAHCQQPAPNSRCMFALSPVLAADVPPSTGLVAW